MPWRVGIFILMPLGLVTAYVFIPSVRNPINDTVSAVISKPSSAETATTDTIRSGIYVHRILDSDASWRVGHLVGWDGLQVTSEDDRAAVAPPESAPTPLPGTGRIAADAEQESGSGPLSGAVGRLDGWFGADPPPQRDVEMVSFSFPGTPSEIIVVRYATDRRVFDLESWRPLILDSFREASSPFTLAVSREVSIGNYPALETGYFDEDFVFLERYAAIGRDAYVVRASTSVDFWQRERDLLGTILESFRASPRT